MKIPPFKDTFKTPEIVFHITQTTSSTWRRDVSEKKVNSRKRILKTSVN